MKQKLLSFVMVNCFLFLILTTLSMFFYPGGTRSNPGQVVIIHSEGIGQEKLVEHELVSG